MREPGAVAPGPRSIDSRLRAAFSLAGEGGTGVAFMPR